VGELTRILIVDDHPHGREGMRDIIAMEPSFTVVGEAPSGEQAVEEALRLAPDIVLMDINMPGIGGLEATQRIKSRQPSIKIIIVTVEDDITFLFEAVRRGAQGYLLKNLRPSAWHAYLRAVAFEEAPMEKELAHMLLREFSGGHSEARNAARDGRQLPTSVTPLTQREREVLERVARGESNREIAEGLGLSEHTVKNHMKNILQKLHLDNRVQLTRFAYENGLA
jgi:two-component system, NarL family, nitrate/nitrite response regulator NarL